MSVAIAVGWLLAGGPSNEAPSEPVAVGYGVSTVEKSKIHLYFGDPHGRFLRAEQRVMGRPKDDIEFGRQLIEALRLGPKQGGGRTLPEGARLRAFFLSGSTAYADFTLEAFSEHPGGVETELLTIYAIVNTLVVNVEAIREVKILIGGQDASTLAGHVDLQHPFAANMMWIR